MGQPFVSYSYIEHGTRLFDMLRQRFSGLKNLLVHTLARIQSRPRQISSRLRKPTESFSTIPYQAREPFMKRGVVVSLFLVVSILAWLTLLTFVVLFSIQQTRQLVLEQRDAVNPPAVMQENPSKLQTVSLALSRLEAQVEVVRSHQLGILSYLAAQKLEGKEKAARLQESLAYREKADALEGVLMRTEEDYSRAMQSLRSQLATAQPLSDLRSER
ncbi:MAG: hypothetical protein KDD55_01590 [Bdellovibrionales bacterium]|nr:hypothetical protein [Bdellovibrionales bacterium]